MGGFQKTTYSSGTAPRRTVIRHDVVELGTTDLKQRFDSGRPWESKVITVRLRKIHYSPYKFKKKPSCQKVDDPGHVWA
jgi:hypothetical protein